MPILLAARLATFGDQSFVFRHGEAMFQFRPADEAISGQPEVLFLTDSGRELVVSGPIRPKQPGSAFHVWIDHVDMGEFEHIEDVTNAPLRSMLEAIAAGVRAEAERREAELVARRAEILSTL